MECGFPSRKEAASPRQCHPARIESADCPRRSREPCASVSVESLPSLPTYPLRQHIRNRLSFEASIQLRKLSNLVKRGPQRHRGWQRVRHGEHQCPSSLLGVRCHISVVTQIGIEPTKARVKAGLPVTIRATAPLPVVGAAGSEPSRGFEPPTTLARNQVLYPLSYEGVSDSRPRTALGGNEKGPFHRRKLRRGYGPGIRGTTPTGRAGDNRAAAKTVRTEGAQR